MAAKQKKNNFFHIQEIKQKKKKQVLATAVLDDPIDSPDPKKVNLY